jgi:hypothetical protein
VDIIYSYWWRRGRKWKGIRDVEENDKILLEMRTSSLYLFQFGLPMIVATNIWRGKELDYPIRRVARERVCPSSGPSKG